MYFKEEDKYKISQGDIFQNFEYIRWATLVDGDPTIDSIDIPFFVVLTQSCDLDWDFEDRNKPKEKKRDKYIQSILVCPAYIAELVKEGKHLEESGFIMEEYPDKRRWNLVENNNNARYHFLKKDGKLGLPDLVIDFKQYYTIPTYIIYNVYKEHYVGALKPLFREDLSHRFAFYLSRIGLPDLVPKKSVHKTD